MKNSASKAARRVQKNGKPADRAFSSIVVDGPERAPSRAMLHAVGFTAEDLLPGLRRNRDRTERSWQRRVSS
jgi:hypothetical protein